MATTTNYSWTTPDDTALVKDGAAAIRSLGTAIDSTLKTQIDAQIPDSLLTTKGDIIGATGASTPARLGVGTNNQVLTADSTTATGLKWATAGGGALKEEVFNSSNASWTIPSGVTQVWGLVVGSGGGGGGAGTGGNVGGGAGGAGQVKEVWFTISGDTTLNITVPAGGAGGVGSGVTGPKGSNGSAATIVGNTSSTTYATAAGGGGGGGSSSVTGNSGASGGGEGCNGATAQGGGGGMGSPASNVNGFPFAIATTVGGGASATTSGITGFAGGLQGQANVAGKGITLWGRNLGGGGNGSSSSAMANQFGAGARNSDSNGGAGTANTGAGGGACFSSALALTGGAGGSGLVVLRYVGA